MANETALQIIQKVAKRVGLVSPTTATGSSDVQILQLVELANEEGEQLANRYPWQSLNREKTFTSIASEDQGLLTGATIGLTAADGFKYILNDTIWNRTTQFGPGGPLTPKMWQGLKAANFNGFWSQYRLRLNHLFLLPAPVAGQTIAFEYMSESWVLAVDGTTYKSGFTADDDTSVLDSQLVKAGLTWRWKASKGLDYSEDFNKYEMLVLDAMTRDGTKGAVSMDGCSGKVEPYVVIPAGNWMH